MIRMIFWDVLLCGGRLFPAFACHVVTCHFDDWEKSFMLSVSPLSVTHGRFQTRLSLVQIIVCECRGGCGALAARLRRECRQARRMGRVRFVQQAAQQLRWRLVCCRNKFGEFGPASRRHASQQPRHHAQQCEHGPQPGEVTGRVAADTK